ncbi:MAG: FprA family A-type flavoprotein [Bacteroidales bacterium]|nr:FprA family A-type flavoprotein [Bacteroidales bacterium]
MRPIDDKIIPVSDKVQWVGVLDYDIVTFDIVMETEFGTTYNSYLIQSKQKTLIETVKETFWPIYRKKLEQLTHLQDIKYVVLNHTEPDHSGSLKFLLEEAPDITVVGSGNAIRYLKDQVNREFKHIIVKDGDILDLGDTQLRFISAPNLHWPDSMYTYLENDQLLFTCDSFGCHYCHEEMIDTKVGDFDKAFDYYFDVILKPYSKFMLKALEKIENLPIRAVLTGHGPLLLNKWKYYVDRTKSLSEEYLSKPQPNFVFISYVSAYKNTAKIAEAIAQGVEEGGCKPIVMDIEKAPLGDLEQHLILSKGLVVGTPVINQNILLPTYKLFAAVNPIRDRGKIAGAFGSYGWSGENKTIVKTILESLKWKFIGDGLFFKFSPNSDDFADAKEYGKQIAQAVLQLNIETA